MSDLEQRVHDAIAQFRDLPREQQEAMRRAQRKSWVIGEMMLEHPEMTRAEAERLFNQLGF